MRLDSLLYVRDAVGKDGEHFKCYKIRTMVPNADECLDDVLRKGLNKDGRPINDERITKLGRILRRYWIDELPQLYNLLKRDIKLVGIRPMPEIFWGFYPEELKRDALKQRPRFMGVQYAIRNYIGGDFDMSISILQNYLKEGEAHPLRTDIKYFFRIFSNIVFRGMRSS